MDASYGHVCRMQLLHFLYFKAWVRNTGDHLSDITFCLYMCFLSLDSEFQLILCCFLSSTTLTISITLANTYLSFSTSSSLFSFLYPSFFSTSSFSPPFLPPPVSSLPSSPLRYSLSPLAPLPPSLLPHFSLPL